MMRLLQCGKMVKRRINEPPTNEKEGCDALRRLRQRGISAAKCDANVEHNGVAAKAGAEFCTNEMSVSEC
jgi:hypothetical protein